MKLNFIFLLLGLSFSISAFTAEKNPDAIVGTWLTGDGTGHIQIFKQGNKYFGKIAWLKDTTNPDGSELRDVKNPNKNLRNRPIKGLVILRDFQFEGENIWEDGKVYDPQSGSDYSCKITLKNANTLEVRGYIGLAVFGRSDTWKRVK